SHHPCTSAASILSLHDALPILSALEVQDQVTVRDFALVAQRLEMIRRLTQELDRYALELGTDGRMLTLQLHELGGGVEELRQLRSEEHTSELQSRENLVCRLLL